MVLVSLELLVGSREDSLGSLGRVMRQTGNWTRGTPLLLGLVWRLATGSENPQSQRSPGSSSRQRQSSAARSCMTTSPAQRSAAADSTWEAVSCTIR